MSSTSNIQDLLVNVFRPTYRYDSTTGFVPSLSLSNLSEVNTKVLKAQIFSISDSNKNTYVGSNAGVNAVNTFSNTAIGYSALGSAVNADTNVAVGVFALNALANSSNNTALGSSNTISGEGQGNILIGRNLTMASGSGNILIGTDLSVGNVTKKFQLGTLLYGDLSSGFIGVNTSVPEAAFDISGVTVFRGKVGFQNPFPVYSLDVNGSIYANDQFIGGEGTQRAPLYTFKSSPGSGMFVPDISAGFGASAFGISASGDLAAVFASNKVYFFKDLDVSGTFSACNVNINAFSVVNGTEITPSMTFTSDNSTGIYLVSSNRLGLATGSLRRMEILSNGDVSFGHLVVKDISYTGAIVGSDPGSCNVIGGVTLCNGNVILTGVATNTNLLVPGWIRNTDPATALDISGGTISNSALTRSSNFRGSAGSVAVPTYSFVSDPTTGIHSAGTSQLAFDTAGVQRMVIRNGNVGIGVANPGVALEVVGDVSAITYNGPGGTAGAPHYTFSDDRTTGLFFPGANMVGFTAGGRERMRISNGFVAIGTTVDPSSALDVSGTFRIIGANGNITFSNGTIDVSGTPLVSTTGAFSNAATTSNRIGGVTLSNFDLCMASTGRIFGMASNSNYIGGVTLSNFDLSLISTGRILAPTGNSNRIGGVTLSNFDLCMASTGRIFGMASNSNYIGGVTLSNFDLSLISTGKILAPAGNSNQIGGVTFSNFDLCMASTGRILGMASNSNYIGGVTLSNFDLSLISTGKILAPAGNSNQIGGVTLSNFDLCMASTGRILGMASTSNYVGGVTLSNFDLSMAPTGRILAPILRNALIPSLFDISSGNISNSGVHIASNFLAAPGGVPRPAYAFTTDPSSGLDLVRTSYLAFDTSGVQRMCISGDLVGIGTTAPFSTLDLSYGTLSIRRRVGPSGLNTNNTASIEIGGGYDNGGAGATAFPAIAFQYYLGGYRHFIRSRHAGALAANSGIDFLINSGNDASSTGPGIFNSNMMSVTGLGVGIGTNFPGAKLEVIGRTARDSTTTPLADSYFSVKSDLSQSFVENVMMEIGAANRTFGSYSSVNRYRLGFQASATGNNFAINAIPTASNTYNSDGPEVNRFTIGETGNVGIGTTAPSAALDVSHGNVGAVGIQLRQGGTQVGIGLNITNGTRSLDLGIASTPGAWAANSICGDAILRTSAKGRLLFNANGTGCNAALTISGDYVGVGCFNQDNVGLIYLDVCGATRFGRSINGNNNLILIADTVSGKPLTRHGISMYNVSTGTGNGGNDLAFNTYDDTGAPLMTAPPAMLIRRSNGNVGVLNASPQYPLDVAGTTTSAAINASTWSRSAVSTSYFGVYSGQASGGGMIWTTCNAINSSIMEVADNNGTYFRPKVSGIYSFNMWLGGSTAGNPTAYLDVSGNANHNVLDPGSCPQLAVFQTVSGSGRLGLAWTGYLPNAAHYYKIKMVSLYGIATNAGGGKMYVTFLGEVGSGSAQPW